MFSDGTRQAAGCWAIVLNRSADGLLPPLIRLDLAPSTIPGRHVTTLRAAPVDSTYLVTHVGYDWVVQRDTVNITRFNLNVSRDGASATAVAMLRFLAPLSDSLLAGYIEVNPPTNPSYTSPALAVRRPCRQ